MIQLLANNWWGLELRGILTIVFGLLALFLPALTLGLLVLLFGVYALAEGAVLLVMSFRRQYRYPVPPESANVQQTDFAQHRWITALQGIAGIAAGIAAFLYPGITGAVLLLIIAMWAIATGVLEIIGAIRLRKEMKSEWLLVLSGVLSLVFAYLLLANPAAGALALVWVIGVYAIAFGVISIALGFKMHHVHA